MRNIKLTLSYDGTDFRGWQIQPGQPTIQGTLVDVLRKLTGENLTVHAAGRTDSGVHALGPVAVVQTGDVERSLGVTCNERGKSHAKGTSVDHSLRKPARKVGTDRDVDG